MKYFQILTLVSVLSWTTSAAWAQFGLYGSPGMVRLPSAQTQASASDPLPFRPGPLYASPLKQVSAVQPAPPPAGAAPRPLEPGGDAPSVVDQMLSEANRPLPPPWANGSACGPDVGCRVDEVFGCGDSEGCAPCYQPNWYALARGLVMTRNEANRLWTTYESGNNPNQLPTGPDWDWRGGGEVRFGRYFCCGTWALEAAYWTLDPFTDMASQTHASGVATPLDFTDVVWRNGGLPGLPVDLFDGAAEHRVWRRAEVHNVEVNLIRNQMGFDRCSPFDLDWSVGVRFFRFDEDLTFGSRDAGTTDWTTDLTAVGYLEDGIRNNLIGPQFGCNLNYCVGNWALSLAPKVGIYNNHIRHRFSAYRGDGELFDVAPAGYPSYPVSSTKDVVSFLTEIDVSLSWQFATKWSAEIGYRVVAATGIGLTEHQIPPYVV
ncbi:MAG: BBP7 family outer membrane beta-barrel protein, partial [Planctomycetota bacterium]